MSPAPQSPAAERALKTGRAAVAQRRAARPDASVWVAASAGTGKTKVLTDRVLSLLLHGSPPERILCLTFTKAAAAEMANRVAERLSGWTSQDDAKLAQELEALLGEVPEDATMATARQLFARVLDAPGGIKIQTTHAFCQSLLGRFPLEAGVAPHFRVLDERSAEELLKQAREEVLAAARHPKGAALAEAIAAVTAETDEERFLELLGQLIAERGRITALLRAHDGVAGLSAKLRQVLGLAEGETADTILAAATADQAFDLMGLTLAARALAEGGKTDRAHGVLVADWLAAAPEARARTFGFYLGAFFKDGGQGDRFKTLAHQDALAAEPAAEEILSGEAQRLEAVRGRLRAAAVARANAALLQLGEAILAAYGRHKRARGLLDFDDLILETRALLRRPGVAAWVLYKLDGGLDHVLIDEAQDTNPEQWEVIRALSEEFFAGEGAREGPRTVFAVGDAKQSIYSFQRADPRGFEAMRGHFARRSLEARLGWDTVELEVSFRSTAAVLEAVDAVFADPEARDGVIFGDEALSHDPVRVGQAGLVELWPAADPLERDAPEDWSPPTERGGAAAPSARLARLIARRIHRWTLDPAGAQDPESWLASKDRRLRPGDILVLVRRRNAFVEALVRELKQQGVPVAGVDRMVLTEQLAVMDLVALGRVLLLPEDDLTLAAVLKGPLIGLDEAQLFTLAYDREGSLWSELKRRAPEDAAFARAVEVLRALQARADFLRPYELYAGLLGPGGGRQKLLGRLGPEAADPIEEFLSLALAFEREQVPSLEGFLYWLEAAAQTVKRDLEHGGDAVRVMTVHGAKGLQAPVVFLPDTLQVPQAKSGLFWLEDHDGLPLWPVRRAYDGAAAQAARAAAAALQDQEYRRLLYVAMTRAEDRLYVCGWNTRRPAPAGCWHRMIERALPAVAEEVEFDFRDGQEDGWTGRGYRLATAQAAAPEETGETLAEAGSGQPLPLWAQVPAPPEPVPPRPLAPSRPAGEEPPVSSPLGPDEGRRFRRGLIVHRLLESLPDLAQAARAAAARRFLARPTHGLDRAAQEEILAETLAVLDHPDFAPLFGPDSRAEVSITGTVTGRSGVETISGQIDRLAVSDDRVLVVDYKTNRPPPETVDRVPTVYLRQMAAYRALLAEIYPGQRIDCCLLWTETPRIMQLGDDLLADHAP